MYYEVEHLSDRRVRSQDGTVEYLVHWKGYDHSQDTWEPRRNLVEACADAVQVIDQQQMDLVDDAIARWRTSVNLDTTSTTTPTSSRKRQRHSSEGDEGVEVLSGLLLRHHNGYTAAANTEGSVVMLGEVVLSEEYAASLGHLRRRKHAPVAGGTKDLCAPASVLERWWREDFGISLMHSCVSSASCATAATEFYMDAPHLLQMERHIARHMRIVGIAPPDATRSGSTYARPVSFVPWIGEEEAERLRRESVADHPSLAANAQELLKAQRELMVVRYTMEEAVEEGVVCDGGERGGQPRSSLVVESMPLSVFRVVFPQLLIDYLLAHSVVLEGIGA